MNVELHGSYRHWIGRTERRVERLSAAPVSGLAATLGRGPAPSCDGDVVAALWHWVYFLPNVPAGDLVTDQPTPGGPFLPPIPLPHRVWTAGRLTFHRPVRVGDVVERTSTVRAVSQAGRRSDPCVTVTVTHEWRIDGVLALSEDQDLTYRGSPAAADGHGRRVPIGAVSREVWPDPALLFRYSALTFDAHRIHFDRHHATQVAGFAGLIVQTPLTATLLMELARDQVGGRAVASFEFKSVRALDDLDAFTVNAQWRSEDRMSLWARSHAGALAVEANVVFRT